MEQKLNRSIVKRKNTGKEVAIVFQRREMKEMTLFEGISQVTIEQTVRAHEWAVRDSAEPETKVKLCNEMLLPESRNYFNREFLLLM